MEHGEGGSASLVGRLDLSRPECSADVPLAERAPRPRAEHEVVRGRVSRPQLVLVEDPRELLGDRHGTRGSVRLRGCEVPVPVDLPGELDFGVVLLISLDLLPHEAE